MQKGILIRVDGFAKMVELNLDSIDINTTKTLQNYVSGYIETVSPRLMPFNGLLMIVNENGKLTDKPKNLVASAIYAGNPFEIFDYIAGDVILAQRGLNAHGEPDIVGIPENEIINLIDAIIMLKQIL